MDPIEAHFIDCIKIEENATMEMPDEINPQNVNLHTHTAQYIKLALNLSDISKGFNTFSFSEQKQAEVHRL